MSIIDTFEALIAATHTPLSVALREINADLGENYQLSRWGEWRNGKRAIPQPVQDFLLRAGIEQAIRACGGKPPREAADLDRLAAMLSPPVRNDG